MSEQQALMYPVNRAFDLAAFDAETNPAGPLERDSDGYIAQEMDRQQAAEERRPVAIQ